MKLFLATLFLITSTAHATTLTVVNRTGALMRIVELSNKCTGSLLKTSPLYLKNEERITFDTTPVVHAYLLCGSGTCSGSAIGMNGKHKSYTLEVILDGGWITANQTPDIWKQGNFTCR